MILRRLSAGCGLTLLTGDVSLLFGFSSPVRSDFGVMAEDFG
jgi:hypothetical protein